MRLAIPFTRFRWVVQGRRALEPAWSALRAPFGHPLSRGGRTAPTPVLATSSIRCVMTGQSPFLSSYRTTDAGCS